MNKDKANQKECLFELNYVLNLGKIYQELSL